MARVVSLTGSAPSAVGLLVSPESHNFDEVRRAWRRAACGGFGSLWLVDAGDPEKPGPPGVPLDPWTAVAPLAACAPGRPIGVLIAADEDVAPLPRVLRAMTASLATGGAFAVGVGTGWSTRPSHAGNGSAPDVTGRVEGYLRAFQRTGEPRCDPDEIAFGVGHAAPTVWVGGQDPTLDDLARRMDAGWIGSGSPEAVARRARGPRAGNGGTALPPRQGAILRVLAVAGEDARRRSLEALACELQLHPREVARTCVVGDAARIRAGLEAHRRHGLDPVILEPLVPVARAGGLAATLEDQVDALVAALTRANAPSGGRRGAGA